MKDFLWVILSTLVTFAPAEAAKATTPTPVAKKASTSLLNELRNNIQQIDAIHESFNAGAKNPKRVSNLLASYEKFMGRAMSPDEKDFIAEEFADAAFLPRLELKGSMIQVYQGSGPKKQIILSFEIVDAEKYIFASGSRQFQLSPNNSLDRNVQILLQELNRRVAQKK